MTTTVLAEKPDQAKKFANALAGKRLKNEGGCFKFTSEIFGDTIVTWGIGHLVGLSLPDRYEDLQVKDKWDYANLPFLPEVEKLKYEVLNGKGKQFKVVKECLDTADTIVIATDPDREGENIAYNIFRLCGKIVKGKNIKRLWINSLAENEIIRGFKSLRDAAETEVYFYEANARQIADYLVGMNYTELYTLKLHEKGIDGVVSLGRVQTPVNTIVVENDLAIKNFKPEKYKMLECSTIDKQPNVKFKNNTEYFSDDDLTADINKYSIKLDSENEATVKSVTIASKQTEPPKLFNLGAIQEYCNAKFKYPAKNTDKIIQGLYEQGFLSYPRTDCELITENELEYLKHNLDLYKNILNLTIETTSIPGKRFVDGKKVLEHYALIPTTVIPDLSKFNEEEKNVYKAIALRACLMFAEPYKYENTKVELDVNGYVFSVSGSVPVSLGWKKAVNEDIDESSKVDDDQDIKLPKFTEDEKVSINITSIEKTTKEPKRLTEGKLVGKTGVMAKLGLGTPATRSSVVDTILNRGYIKVENTKVYPTPKGYLLWDLTKNKDLLIGKPENTAQWEAYLNKISKNEYTREAFLKQIYKYISVTIDQLKGDEFKSEYVDKSVDQNSFIIGNYRVKEKIKVFEVSNDTDDSKFIIFKSICGKNLTIKNVKDLLSKGKTTLIKGFKSKKGNIFNSKLKLNKETKKIEMEFE